MLVSYRRLAQSSRYDQGIVSLSVASLSKKLAKLTYFGVSRYLKGFGCEAECVEGHLWLKLFTQNTNPRLLRLGLHLFRFRSIMPSGASTEAYQAAASVLLEKLVSGEYQLRIQYNEETPYVVRIGLDRRVPTEDLPLDTTDVANAIGQLFGEETRLPPGQYTLRLDRLIDLFIILGKDWHSVLQIGHRSMGGPGRWPLPQITWPLDTVFESMVSRLDHQDHIVVAFQLNRNGHRIVDKGSSCGFDVLLARDESDDSRLSYQKTLFTLMLDWSGFRFVLPSRISCVRHQLVYSKEGLALRLTMSGEFVEITIWSYSTRIDVSDPALRFTPISLSGVCSDLSVSRDTASRFLGILGIDKDRQDLMLTS